MSKNKLKKFAEMAQMNNVFELPLQSILQGERCDLKGFWRKNFFKNSNPLTLELGCGRGEYTVGLAKLFPEKNFIGIDIKGARMWSGATQANALGLTNAAFVRTDIGNLGAFFAENEIDEIWLTFPDPQMKKRKKRLTSTGFLQNYRNILKDNGLINLKTDSNFLFTYTKELIDKNSLVVKTEIADLYSDEIFTQRADLQIKTCYESQWLARNISIKYLQFILPKNTELQEPEIEIEIDEYRSYGRQKRSELNFSA
ncbi:MAG: tRNA (guanosine(46)-N7)-methyltransferase TrmB [Prevotellaceae bacterium]|jgi:tRNA (guanine-N7-)-methyltransferase|nr:tRNA (guanosine(46)-N7)-methyltransferase TrmB [Prevotellaceae bacterium]